MSFCTGRGFWDETLAGTVPPGRCLREHRAAAAHGQCNQGPAFPAGRKCGPRARGSINPWLDGVGFRLRCHSKPAVVLLGWDSFWGIVIHSSTSTLPCGRLQCGVCGWFRWLLAENAVLHISNGSVSASSALLHYINVPGVASGFLVSLARLHITQYVIRKIQKLCI